MEFDLQTLAPTYRLIMGVPGSSNAIAIASKLGLRQDVIDFARSNVSDEKLAFERVIQNADEIRKDYERKLAELAEEKRLLLAEKGSRREAEQQFVERKKQVVGRLARRSP